MKTKAISCVAAILAVALPMTANAAALTLQCGIGQVRILNRVTDGSAKVAFRDNVYTPAETLCEPKRNAYCAIDTSEPGVIHMRWTMKDGAGPDGQLRLQYDYVLDLASNTLSSRMRDMFGAVGGEDPVSRCETGPVRPTEDRVAWNGPFRIQGN